MDESGGYRILMPIKQDNARANQKSKDSWDGSFFAGKF